MDKDSLAKNDSMKFASNFMIKHWHLHFTESYQFNRICSCKVCVFMRNMQIFLQILRTLKCKIQNYSCIIVKSGKSWQKSQWQPFVIFLTNFYGFFYQNYWFTISDLANFILLMLVFTDFSGMTIKRSIHTDFMPPPHTHTNTRKKALKCRTPRPSIFSIW